MRHERFVQLLLVALAVWAGSYSRYAIGPLQEAMRSALALTDSHMAILLGPASATAIMVGTVPLGLAIDRYSRARLMVAFVVLGLLGSIVTALTSNFLVLFAARALVTLAEIASLVAAYSLVSDLYAPAQRGRATMLVAAGVGLGTPAAFAIGGLLLGMHGADAESWRWALVWMTWPPLVIVLLLTLKVREPPRTDIVVNNPPAKQAFAELWRYRNVVVPLLAARCMVWVADGATVIWAAPFLSRRFDLPPERVGVIMATLLLAASLTATVVGGVLADMCQRAGGPHRTMQVMAVVVLISLPASLFGLAPNVLSASVLLVVFITLGFMTNMVGSTVATIVIPNEVRGTCLSLTMVVGAFFGMGLAPLLVSSLTTTLGGAQMLGSSLAVVCVASSAVGVIIFTFSSRSFPREVRA